MVAVIELRSVWIRRGKSDILRDVDMRIERGETFAMIGPTGAGKTTLLRVLDLLDPPDRGRIFFDGQDVTEYAKARLSGRRRMAMVFQKPAMFNATVRENVAYGLRVRGISGSRRDERVQRALEDVGLADYGDRRAKGLSGGEVQRVALARALVLEPDVLLLDEATANLDPRTASAIERLIGRAQKRDLTIVMATHDLAQSRRLADRIGVMMEGELVQVGSPEEIFERPGSRTVASFVDPDV